MFKVVFSGVVLHCIMSLLFQHQLKIGNFLIKFCCLAILRISPKWLKKLNCLSGWHNRHFKQFYFKIIIYSSVATTGNVTTLIWNKVALTIIILLKPLIYQYAECHFADSCSTTLPIYCASIAQCPTIIWNNLYCNYV